MPKSRVRNRGRKKPRSPRVVPSALAQMALPVISFPADVLGLAGPEQTEIGLDIVFRLPEPHPAYRLAVRLLRRIMGKSHVELWGTALGGIFDVQLTGTADNQWRMQTRVADVSIDGTQMLAILDTFDAIGRSTGVGLAAANQTPTTWSEIATAGLSAPPEGLRPVVEAHAEIERRLAVSMPVPVNYTIAEIRDTVETAALLRGETVSQTWAERRWELPEDDADHLIEGAFADGGSVLMEIEEEWVWTIGRREIAIGTVAVAYQSARINKVLSGGKAGGSKTLILVPGPANQVLFRLVRTAAEHPDVPDQQWFWEPEWQAREAEVDGFVNADAVTVHGDSGAFLAHLDALASDHD